MYEDEGDDVDRQRTIEDVKQAEEELIELLWHEKAVTSIRSLTVMGDIEEASELRDSVGSLCRQIEESHGGSDSVRLNGDFELGMLMGKVSALRWVLGAGWDFFDC